jgi:hypothetical protein
LGLFWAWAVLVVNARNAARMSVYIENFFMAAKRKSLAGWRGFHAYFTGEP